MSSVDTSNAKKSNGVADAKMQVSAHSEGACWCTGT